MPEVLHLSHAPEATEYQARQKGQSLAPFVFLQFYISNSNNSYPQTDCIHPLLNTECQSELQTVKDETVEIRKPSKKGQKDRKEKTSDSGLRGIFVS